MLGLLCGILIAQATPNPDATPDVKKQWYEVKLNGWPVKVKGWMEGKQVKWWNEEQRFDFPPSPDCEAQKSRAKNWYHIKVNGTKAIVWGWSDSPRVEWCDEQQKWSFSSRRSGDIPDGDTPANGVSQPSGTPTPTPNEVPRDPAGQPFLFGVDASHLGQSDRGVRASSPSVEAEFRLIQAQMAVKKPDPPGNPDRIKVPDFTPAGLGLLKAWLQLDTTKLIMRAATVAMIIFTAVLLIHSRVKGQI